MKRVFIILTLAVITLTANAQQRIIPMLDIDERTYEEAIELLNIMERTMRIERYDRIKLNNEHFTTYYGEIDLKRDGENSIRISIVEFTKMLEEHISYPSRRFYEIGDIQTELILQTAEMYKYISARMMRDKRIRGINIKIDSRTGGSYIIVYLHKF